ncbi:glycosyltransferase family 4 protein [Thermococcus sp. GR4]|uniref:glycosyltransferase n=1 Tax=Thermococcus sp. GR4 TaxID=1638254 RepID=UPI001431D2FE|nr:glycosyltransferase family 4 protein [Thermococcus sp. GR4]
MRRIKSDKNTYVIQVVPSGVGGIQTYANALEKRLQAEGIATDRLETYTVDITSPNMLLETLKKTKQIALNLIRLSKLARTHKKDKTTLILHCHVAANISFWENSLYSVLGRLLGIPSIFHVHSGVFYDEYIKSTVLIKKIRQAIFTIPSVIISLSIYWKRQIMQLDNINKEKIRVIYNFVDSNKFKRYNKHTCREILKLPPDKKIVFSIGRLFERKGYQYLIEAVPLIVKQRNDIQVFIGGKGPMREYLEQRIKELEIEDYVTLLGFIQGELLPVWLNAADVFVMPSLLETFPIVMLEALASGIPFVGSRVGAVPEIIISDDYGLLVEPANPQDLAEKMLIALEKKWNKEKIRKYAEQFTWERVAKRILEIYRRVLDEE